MAKAKSKRERLERRYYPKSSGSPKVVSVLGGLGALLAGAGAYGQFGSLKVDEPYKFIPWLLASGTALIGGAFWFGTSGEPGLRVGDGGLAIDKGSSTRRMPWHEVESIRWDSGLEALVVAGKDEATVPFSITVRIASHGPAAAAIAKEAKARVPDVVDLGDDVRERITASAEGIEGEVVKLDPLQVVGLRCAASDKIISFEPDARLCTRCERAYHKNHVPKKCKCGAALAAKSKDDEDAA